MRLMEKLKKEYPNLSKNKKKIADYFLNESLEVTFSSTRQIAKVLQISESLVVKFCNDLGYSGFIDLQNELRDEIRAKFGRSDKIKQFFNDDSDDFIKRVFDIEIQNLLNTSNLNTSEQILAASVMLSGAANIYTVGARNAGAIATVLGIHLNEMLDNVIILNNLFNLSFDYLRNAGEQDVLFAVSLPEYSEFTLSVLGIAKQKGIKIIAITDSEFSPIAKFADICFFISSHSPSFICSHVASLALINAIIIRVALLNRDKVVNNLSEIDDIVFSRFQMLEKN